MKGKGRSVVRKQRDSCDVWLDPSALKRRKVMKVATRSALTLLGQHSPPAAIIGSLHPCTKQTTISTFFTAQKTGEKTTDPNERLMTSASSNDTINLKDTELLRGKWTRAPPSVLQPSSLQDCQGQPAKPTNISGPFLCDSLPARAQGHPGPRPIAQEAGTATEREACLTTDLVQRLGEKGAFLQQRLAPASPLKDKNNSWQREGSPTSFSWRNPSFKINPNRRTDAGRRCGFPSSWAGATLADDSDSENMDPDLEKTRPEAARLRGFNQTGFGGKHSDAARCENGSLATTQRLFTQDSEGHRVILHRLGGEGSEASLPEELWGRKRSPGRSSSNNKSCFRDGWAGDRSPPGSLEWRAAPPPLAERTEKSCYDLLFTEDSEGNKVIKH